MKSAYNFLQLYWVLRNRSHQVKKVKSEKYLESLLLDISFKPESNRASSEAVMIAIILDNDHEIIHKFYKDLKRNPTSSFNPSSLTEIIRYACQDYDLLILEMNSLLNSKSFLDGSLSKRSNDDE